MKPKHQAKTVILLNARGEEVERHRTDRMNFDAFTWVVAQCEKQHGPVTYQVEELKG